MTVATWSGGEVTLGDLEDQLESELREIDVRHALERYELLQHTLDARVEEDLLAREQRRRGFTSLEQLFAVEVNQKAGEPTEEELRTAYAVFVQQMPQTTFEDAAPVLRSRLIEQRRAERHAAFLEELRAAAQLKVDLRYPDIPRVNIPERDHDPSVGPSDAKVTIVEFAELQCFYCRKAAPVLDRLLAEHGDDVRVVYKDYPLSGHESARAGAVASHCAGEQGRFWEMNRRLLDQPDRLTPVALREQAAALSLDLDKFDRCSRDEVWGERIDEDVRDGRAAGVGATPTFFVNGLLVAGAVPFGRLDALVDQELAARGARSSHHTLAAPAQPPVP